MSDYVCIFVGSAPTGKNYVECDFNKTSIEPTCWYGLELIRSNYVRVNSDVVSVPVETLAELALLDCIFQASPVFTSTIGWDYIFNWQTTQD